MEWYWWLLIIIAIIMVAAVIALYFIGRRAEKKKAEQDKMVASASQTVSLLIIDKKKMKLKEAGLPPAVLNQTPWYLKGTKAPVVKVKAGPNIMTLLCAPEIFDDVPVKKEVKAVVSGLYLTAIKGSHGKREAAPAKKETWFTRLKKRAGV